MHPLHILSYTKLFIKTEHFHFITVLLQEILTFQIANGPSSFFTFSMYSFYQNGRLSSEEKFHPIKKFA